MAIVQSSGQLEAVSSPWYPSSRGAGVALYEGSYLDYAAIWRTQPNVRTVVGFLARNMAQLGLHIFELVSESDRQRVRDGIAGRWLRHPTTSPKVSIYDLVSWIVHDLCVFDDVFLLKATAPTGRVVTVPLRPQQVELVGGGLLDPELYRVHGSRGWRDFDPDEIIHIHGYNPDDRRIGVSPMETLRRVIAEDVAAGAYREKFWLNGARFEGVIERPTGAPTWSPAARSRFRTEWQSAYSGTGGDQGGAPVLEEGMTFKEASFNAKDAEYIAARKLTRQEVASAFYVQPAMVGILENANFSNMKEQHRSTYQDTLGPIMTQLSQAFNLQLAGDLGLPDTAYFEFNIKEKLRGSFEEEASALQTAVGAPHMTRNEARARQNLPAIDGGDELVTPLNVLIGGQASATDSGSQNLRRRAAARKVAVKAMDEEAADQADTLRDVLVAFFGRQQAAVLARLGALDDPDLQSVWQRARWDRELTRDLYNAAVVTAQAAGVQVADELDDEELDVTVADGVDDALAESSGSMAGEINSWTEGQLASALAGDDPAAAARDVFVGLIGTRAAIYATSRTNTVWNFGRGVAGKTVGATSKRWRVTSSNPRPTHESMDGETVPIGEPFSNGAMWPGDPVLDIDERAGCECTFDVLKESPS